MRIVIARMPKATKQSHPYRFLNNHKNISTNEFENWCILDEQYFWQEVNCV